MSTMDFQQVRNAINAVTTDWSIRGPFHEDDDKYHALLRNEWVGDGFTNRRQALDAIYAQVKQEAK